MIKHFAKRIKVLLAKLYWREKGKKKSHYHIISIDAI